MRKIDLKYILGIGASTLLWVLILSELVERLSETIMIVGGMESQLIIWIPKLAGIIVFGLIANTVINRITVSTVSDYHKTLIRSVILFTAVLLFQFLYNFLEFSWLVVKFQAEYQTSWAIKDGNQLFQAFMDLNSIIKYLIFGFLVFFKK